jgi:hypothetical protein
VIGEELGLSGEELDLLRWAAFLHDVGKVTIPAEVLNKTETLTDEEWELVRRHPDEGARIAAPLRPWLGEWFRAIAEHHEHWDGGGYPRGLKGEEIGFGARIVAVADAFDVMTALRSYRTPVNPDAARRELVNERGHHFDPAVVRALLNCSLGRLRRALGPLAWVTQVPLVAAAGSHAPRFGGDKIDTSHALPHLHPAASLHPAAQLPAGAHGAAPHDGGGAGHDGLATAVQGPGPNDR